MKTILETEDIETIVNGVVEKLKNWSIYKKEEEKIFNKKELAEYLHLPTSWIDKNLNKLPRLKLGKYVRFRKSDIDEFLDQEKLRTRSPRRLMLLMMPG